MASAIYYEARGEPIAGQRAVLEVIRHRAKVRGKSICGVVKEPYQFSWYGQKPIRKMDSRMWKLLENVRKHPPVLKSEKWQFFFSGKRKPRWAYKMKCIKIGGHRFCRLNERKYDRR